MWHFLIISKLDLSLFGNWSLLTVSINDMALYYIMFVRVRKCFCVYVDMCTLKYAASCYILQVVQYCIVFFVLCTFTMNFMSFYPICWMLNPNIWNVLWCHNIIFLFFNTWVTFSFAFLNVAFFEGPICVFWMQMFIVSVNTLVCCIIESRLLCFPTIRWHHSCTETIKITW